MTRRFTGFPPMVRSLVLDRSGGRCERCGVASSDVQLHHRRARQMGSTRRPETNLPANAAALCMMCHHIVESHRAQAYDDGWLVRQTLDPAAVPVQFPDGPVLLDNEGNYRKTAA